MTKEKLLNSLIEYLEQYLPNSAESIYRNKHMNEAAGLSSKPVSHELNELILTSIVCWNGGTMVIDVLSALSNAAKTLAKKHSDAWVDAAMVDFINFVGMEFCVDYAVYTKDLR